MTVWHPTDNGYADLSDHDSFLNGVPHNTFARMRKEDPLAWCEGGQYKGYWSMTRYDDILKHNRNTALLSSARGIRMEDQSHDEYLARRTFQETDPPEHALTRKLVNDAFSKKVIGQYEEIIRKLCDDILDKALSHEEFDAAVHISRQLPMRMLGSILGLPPQDLDWLVKKGDELIANTDPEYSNFVPDKTDTDEFRYMPFRSPAGADLYGYAKQLLDDRSSQDNDASVLSLVIQPNEQGEVIKEREFQNFFCLLVAAGNDTTRYSLSASIHALATKPELLQMLKNADERLWASATEEFIRWASPTMHFRRTATEDFELHGKKVKEGDKVVYWFISANRDETKFDKPFEVNLERKPNRHMAFGQGGPHVCLGMWLARLEVRLLLQELVGRVRSIEFVDDVEYVRSNFVGGIKRLQVRMNLN